MASYLADVNFAIALFHARHAHNRAAISWLAKQGPDVSILLCRVVQMGLLRILTNSSWLKEDVLTAAAVWKAWDELLTDSRFAEVEEPPGLENAWRLLTKPLPAGKSAETDTYLAAFALAGDYRLVTFDRDFAAFAGVDAEILAPL